MQKSFWDHRATRRKADVQSTLENAKILSRLYPPNKRILLSYAMTCFNLTLQQPLERLNATIDNLRTFLLLHDEIKQDFQKSWISILVNILRKFSSINP